jgi:hypothetical protein
MNLLVFKYNINEMHGSRSKKYLGSLVAQGQY